MGFDYYTCNSCKETFDDCTYEYIFCDCGVTWCSIKCAKKDKYKAQFTVDGGIDEGGESTCKYCREEDAQDDELIPFLLKKLKLSRKAAVQLFYKNK